MDLLLRVDTSRLAHVEYVRRPTRDLVARMLQYRGSIMRAHPDSDLSQHVVILGGGRVRGHDDLPRHGFQLDLGLVSLRDCEPESLLARPGLAPLAVLGHDDAADRERAFASAVAVIRDQGGERTAELLEFAAVLATIRLTRPTIRKIAEEAGMTIENIAADIFRDTGLG